MSVAWAGGGASSGAGAAGVHAPYGRQVGVVQDGQLQRQAALYAADGRRGEERRGGGASVRGGEDRK